MKLHMSCLSVLAVAESLVEPGTKAGVGGVGAGGSVGSMGGVLAVLRSWVCLSLLALATGRPRSERNGVCLAVH